MSWRYGAFDALSASIMIDTTYYIQKNLDWT